MQLVNATAVPADLNLAAVDGHPYRLGTLTAKATFTFDGSGRIRLETQTPFDLLANDEQTQWGLLPADLAPRHDERFEVIVLGTAHAPGGRAVSNLRVEARVGREHREMLVVGDREWISKHETSAPVPFTTMPLSWDRAFGGRAEVWLDERSVLEVTDPMNRFGRGFDPAPQVDGLRRVLGAPNGFPRCDTRRLLPNLERPEAPITNSNDAPDPTCWATMPAGLGYAQLRSLRRAGPTDTNDDAAAGRVADALLRAVPDWVIARPEPGAEVELRNLTPEGSVRFKLPALELFADVVLGGKPHTLRLEPQMLVLLPDAKRFYLVYRQRFQLAPPDGRERCARIRLELPRELWA